MTSQKIKLELGDKAELFEERNFLKTDLGQAWFFWVGIISVRKADKIMRGMNEDC